MSSREESSTMSHYGHWIGEDAHVMEGETCAVNYRISSAHRWATRTSEPAPYKVIEIGHVEITREGVGHPKPWDVPSDGAPTWIGFVGPLLMVAVAIIAALMGARHGDGVYASMCVGMLRFSPMARLGVDDHAAEDHGAVFSSPYPPLGAEEEHGFTEESMMVDYASAHAPTYEAGLRIADLYVGADPRGPSDRRPEWAEIPELRLAPTWAEGARIGDLAERVS